MSDIDKIFLDIVALKSTDKLVLVDKILASMHPINYGVEKVWEKEADGRVDAHSQGYLSAIDDETLFSKYKS